MNNATVTIKSGWLQVNVPYEFQLRVRREANENDISQPASTSTTATAIVTKRDYTVVKVSITPPPVVNRHLDTMLTASVSICDALQNPRRRLLSSSPSSVSYQWTQSSGAHVSIDSSAMNSYQLVLPRFSFDMYGSYGFQVDVDADSDGSGVGGSGSSNITLSVSPPSPVALIAGTQYRTLVYDAALILDASVSFVPGYQSSGGNSLTYFWQFPTLSPSTPVTTACKDKHDQLIFEWQTLDVTSSIIEFPAKGNWLCEGLEYVFNVIVGHDEATVPESFKSAAAAATSTASATVVGAPSPPPPVADTTVHSVSVAIQPLDADKYFLSAFPPTTNLRLQATVTHTVTSYRGFLQISPTGLLTSSVVLSSEVIDTHQGASGDYIEDGYSLVYKWTEVSGAFDAADDVNLAAPAAASAIVVLPQAMASSSSSSGPGVTSPITLRVEVTLFTPSLAVEATAYSQVDVTINSAPTVSGVSVDATIGIAGVTSFTVECTGASDPDEPLSYSFSVASASSPSQMTPLTDKVSSPSTSVTLPVGDVVVVCYAYDRFGAKSLPSSASDVLSVTFVPSIVTNPGNDTCISSSVLTTALSPASLTGQPLSDALQQINALFTSSVAYAASVDCDRLSCKTYDLFVNGIKMVTDAAFAAGGFTDATLNQISDTINTVATANLSSSSNSTGLASCQSSVLTVASVVSDLLAAVSVANNGTDTSSSTGAAPLSAAGTDAAIVSLGASLSSLITESDSKNCAQLDTLTSLVKSTLTASAAGDIAGEQSAGISDGTGTRTGTGITATTTRVGGSSSGGSSSGSAATGTAGGANFDFSSNAIAAGNGCVDIQIVEYASPSLATCRQRAASLAAAAADNDGSGGVDNVASAVAASGSVDVPVSNIVSADLVDCSGNKLNISDLAVPISFLIPISNNDLLAPTTVVASCSADAEYLPNSGAIESQTVVVEKDIECSFFNEATQTWSSDGCVVADNNVTQADGTRAIRCECTHLTEFAIILREKNVNDATSCNIAPAGVFGNIMFLIFACLFFVMLLVGARQTYYTVWAFKLAQKTMLAQHILMCLVCCFRIIICVIYYLLRRAEVRAFIEFKIVAVISGLPYVLMLWLFSLLVLNWAAIYFTARKSQLSQMSTAFQKYKPAFFIGNAVASVFLIALFVTIALSSDAIQRQNITIAGSTIYAIIVTSLSIAFAFFGYGLLVQLSKDFKSSSAEKLCKVGMVFCFCFFGEAVIWMISGTAPELFFTHFNVINSVFFSFDLIALACILLVTRATLRKGVKDKLAMTFKPKMMTARRITATARQSKTQKSKNSKSSKGETKPTSKSNAISFNVDSTSNAGNAGGSQRRRARTTTKLFEGVKDRSMRYDRACQKLVMLFPAPGSRFVIFDPDQSSDVDAAIFASKRAVVAEVISPSSYVQQSSSLKKRPHLASNASIDHKNNDVVINMPHMTLTRSVLELSSSSGSSLSSTLSSPSSTKNEHDEENEKRGSDPDFLHWFESLGISVSSGSSLSSFSTNSDESASSPSSFERFLASYSFGSSDSNPSDESKSTDSESKSSNSGDDDSDSDSIDWSFLDDLSDVDEDSDDEISESGLTFNDKYGDRNGFDLEDKLDKLDSIV